VIENKRLGHELTIFFASEIISIIHFFSKTKKPFKNAFTDSAILIV
jgi:hypothetical protein